MERGERVRGGLLTYLFLSQELTLEEIYANMTEMLLAGVDTVSSRFLLSQQTQDGSSLGPFQEIRRMAETSKGLCTFVSAERLLRCCTSAEENATFFFEKICKM